MGGDKRNKENVETKPCVCCGKDMKRRKNHYQYVWQVKRYCSSRCQAKSYREKNIQKFKENEISKRLREKKRVSYKTDEDLWIAYTKGLVR